ncbi:AMP-binding protein, partial [Streptomyces sp. ID01-9D]
MSEISLLHDVLDTAAERWPDRPAVSGLGTTATYAELRDSSLRLAARLHSVGVREGRRLVISLPPGPLVPALVFAASRVGAVYTVLHEQVVGAPLEHVLGDCEPTLVVADDTSVLDTARARGITAVPAAEARATAFPATPAPVPS